MPRPRSVDDDDLRDRLVSVFRAKGFEGALMGDLAAAADLQRASLYHRFPDGKEQMADVVLDQVGQRFRWILAPMTDDADARRGISETARRLGDFYGAGTLSCVLDTMTLGGTPARIRDHAKSLAAAWIEAMTQAAQRSGQSPADALRAAKDVFVRVEGALVLARVTGDTGAFAEAVALMPSVLAPTEPARLPRPGQ